MTESETKVASPFKEGSTEVNATAPEPSTSTEATTVERSAPVAIEASSPPRSQPRQIYFPPASGAISSGTLSTSPPYYPSSFPGYTTNPASPFATIAQIGTGTGPSHPDYSGTRSLPNASYMEHEMMSYPNNVRYEEYSAGDVLPRIRSMHPGGGSSQQRASSMSPTFGYASVHPSQVSSSTAGPEPFVRMPPPLTIDSSRRLTTMEPQSAPATTTIHPAATEGGSMPGQYADRPGHEQSYEQSYMGGPPPNSATSFGSMPEQQRDMIPNIDGPGSPFISKLMHLLSCDKYRPYIRWNNTGDAFILSHTNQHFAQEILPMLFRHSNTSSFVRQLNMYGFTRLPITQLLEMIDDANTFDSKVSTSCFSAFSHQYLRRDYPDMSKLIRPKMSRSHANRRASNASKKSSTSGSASKPMTTRGSHPYAAPPTHRRGNSAGGGGGGGMMDDDDPDYVQ